MWKENTIISFFSIQLNIKWLILGELCFSLTLMNYFYLNGIFGIQRMCNETALSVCVSTVLVYLVPSLVGHPLQVGCPFPPLPGRVNLKAAFIPSFSLC